MEKVSHDFGGGSLVSFLKEKGLEDESIEHMRKKCMRLEAATSMERVRGNWEFLEREVSVPARKMPVVVHRCPQLLVMGVNERLLPVLSCLRALGLLDKELGDLIVRFPQVLTHSVEEKLCPILAFLQGVGVKEVNLPRIIVRCPRLLSYSIERKLAPTVDFLASLGLGEKEMGRVLAQSPHILGYSVETRLRPTVEYLRGIGLSAEQLRNVAAFFPHILCREAGKVLRPAEEYLRSIGFNAQEISALIGGFPPILIKSIRTSLEPKVQFLVKEMGLQKVELVNFPAYFGYSLHRTIQIRFRKMRARGVQISLSEMLACNKKQFAFRIGLGDVSEQKLARVGGEILC
ncbi:unnamed protein product [Calypogeia fissa]